MKIESYKQGTPCWVCLGTPDTDSGKQFYSTLFGWDYVEAEMMPGMPDSQPCSTPRSVTNWRG